MLSILKSPQIQLPRNIIIITLNAHIFRCLFVCTPTNTERERERDDADIYYRDLSDTATVAEQRIIYIYC